ncbi:hypothetical protein COW36_18825 [bacterium (Candidatus Blackallbacteria) CG17_big_fil_post_rev_8_21_14_2_50_48_46]|uniref:Uncharacterized protein n=1 Tax=bacterium (Candidatus Blackallbacteria) CG17_big_fil_post_rev_8_21_14_2_50_48_46 TaxID=2014261 RepID=A0A2M7G069_9BACT|nr:MAG: hypothetical protein COW64_25645 [bacterium (Candidatus Blackallbacteria) CG18_big_fil_WC_8_21_14_2_50_49_26]PIW14981.1 MAG: hypothetical protein COW36_18825 [bacterium (Candidatus Blackallbacteria) CG17_big_fil_post_rev_8_21_14_2_50_48_46]PIW50062.1 MAG: hypothetical protein COW20_03760 [bacterium (Candidatus Blackallbacteria) CG13_big_fil_rev_8_21_14_2_50_49_14]
MQPLNPRALSSQPPFLPSAFPLEKPSEALSPAMLKETLTLESGQKGTLPSQPLPFEHPLLAETAKKPLKNQPKNLKAKPLEEKKQEKPPEPPPDPDLGIEKPPALVGSKRAPEKGDQAIYEQYLSVQREVRDELKGAGKTPVLSEQKSQMLTKLALRLGQEEFLNLPETVQSDVLRFLEKFELSDLVLAEVQAEGGADVKEGIVTGTGVDGHYTNSILFSLQGLISSHRLSPQLLAALDKFREAPLHESLTSQRMTLIRSALQELAFPEKIEQHSKGTCAPTTVQILLSLKNPELYLQLLADLASPSGEVARDHLNGNRGMEREADTLIDDRSGRSLSSRLIQPAFMEYANGDQSYDNQKDRNSDGKSEYSGLDEKGAVRLSEALFGAGSYAFRYVHAHPDPSWQGFEKSEILFNEIQTALSQGEPVPVGLRWGESAHKILLTALDPSDQKAYFMNPWGEMQTMPLETFRQRLDSASLPRSNQTQGFPVFEHLPGASAKKESYQAIHNWRYYKITDYLSEDPILKSLPETQKDLLREKFRSFRLSPELAARNMDMLIGLSQSGLADERLFQRIEALRDKDELAALVKLYSCSEKLSVERFKALVAAEPDKNLDTAYFELLMDNLENTQRTDALIALALENKAMKEDGRAQVKADSQAKIKDAYSALPSGTSPAELKALIQDADEQTRLAMLLKITDKWDYPEAEKAAEILLSGQNFMQLTYLLHGFEPNTRFVGLDSPEQILRYLRNEVRSKSLIAKMAKIR